MQTTTEKEEKLGPVDTGHDREWMHLVWNSDPNHAWCGEFIPDDSPTNALKCPDCLRIMREKGMYIP